MIAINARPKNMFANDALASRNTDSQPIKHFQIPCSLPLSLPHFIYLPHSLRHQIIEHCMSTINYVFNSKINYCNLFFWHRFRTAICLFALSILRMHMPNGLLSSDIYPFDRLTKILLRPSFAEMCNLFAKTMNDAY